MSMADIGRIEKQFNPSLVTAPDNPQGKPAEDIVVSHVATAQVMLAQADIQFRHGISGTWIAGGESTVQVWHDNYKGRPMFMIQMRGSRADDVSSRAQPLTVRRLNDYVRRVQ
jgi:hypothetical protein